MFRFFSLLSALFFSARRNIFNYSHGPSFQARLCCVYILLELLAAFFQSPRLRNRSATVRSTGTGNRPDVNRAQQIISSAAVSSTGTGYRRDVSRAQQIISTAAVSTTGTGYRRDVSRAQQIISSAAVSRTGTGYRRDVRRDQQIIIRESNRICPA